MELRHLKYFLTVAQELHFRKASEKLFVAQSALSTQIKMLEEELGVQLFNRNKRNVQLTEAGKYLANGVNNIFEQLSYLKNTAKLIDSGLIGNVKIGYVSSAMNSILLGIISKIHKDFSKIKIELFEMPPAVQLEAIKAGNLDVGFLRGALSDKDIQKKVVFEETYSIVLPLNHPVNQKNFKSLKDIAEDQIIILPRSAGESYYDTLIYLCNKAGFIPKIAHFSVYANAVTEIKLVENNMGVSIIPSSLIKGVNAKVKVIELKNIPERTQLLMAWKKKNESAPLLAFLKISNEFIKA